MRWTMLLISAWLAVTPAGPASAGGPVVLVEQGKPVATIVVADEPLPIPLRHKGKSFTVAHAAEELQRFIAEASGARLPVVSASQAPAEGTLVLVGQSALSQKHGLRGPDQPEGLRIATFDRGLAILGEVAPKGTHNVDHEVDRGTLFGVYEFLERIVGYRFYIHVKDAPDLGTVTPSVRDVTVPAGYGLERAPDFPFREGGFATGGDPPAWMRVTRSGGGTGFVGANHTDGDWSRRFPPKDHPLMYALRPDGTRDPHWLCYSAPQTLEGRIERIREFYESPKYVAVESQRHPGPKYIPFEPDDLWDWQDLCRCDRCKAAVRPERGRFGKNSELLFAHGIAAAREIARRWPGKRLAMLAYEGHMLPPDAELPDNLDVQVCLMWSGPLGKEDYWHERNMQLLRDWSRKVGGRRDRLYVWEYYCWPADWTEAPLFFPHYLKKWFLETHAISSGQFVCSGGNPPQFEMFMCWLWHRLMWDRHADVDALLHDHAATFFGPAAGPVEELYRTIIDRYENVRRSRRFDVTYLPPDQIYGETYTAEVIAKLKRLMADGLAACPADEQNIYRRRVAWMQAGFAPFFDEADLAHRWLGRTPTCVVRAVAAAPREENDWRDAATAPLAQGNYGGQPDLAARVAVVRHQDELWVRFTAEEPTPLRDADALRILLRRHDGERTLSIGPPGVPAGGGPAGLPPTALVRNEHRDGWWRVELRLPAGDLGLSPGKPATLQAQFERHRAPRGQAKAKDPGTDYFWMPPMKPPWGPQFRFGQLRIER